jgi:hypothetical protein
VPSAETAADRRRPPRRPHRGYAPCTPHDAPESPRPASPCPPAQVLAELEAHPDARGIAHWERLHPDGAELRSVGIGLTKQRKLAKGIVQDHDLAMALWQTDLYEARILGLLVDEPKEITRAQAERQVEQLHHGMLSHVFSSCDATLAKTSFVVEVAEDWVQDDDIARRICGYGLLYEISKDKKRSAPDEAFFLRHIDRIKATHAGAPRQLRTAMGGALLGIGKRPKVLNAAARVAVQEMGEIEGSPGCEPLDVMKHLTSPYLTKKLGL